MPGIPIESHRTHSIGWLRAAVLVAGVAGRVAGAMSLAAGEYVSASSQSDTERAGIAREREELATDASRETAELAGIYMQRGLDPDLAQRVARQLMAADALGAHTRDELGISEAISARPLQAAWASAAAFTVGAGLPLLSAWLAPQQTLVLIVGATSLLFLALLGGPGGPTRAAPPSHAASCG